MVLLSFALTFHVGPNIQHRWAWVTPGSLAGTIAFLVFCFLFRLYVQNSEATTRWERSEGSWCCCSGSGPWPWCSWARPKWIG